MELAELVMALMAAIGGGMLLWLAHSTEWGLWSGHVVRGVSSVRKTFMRSKCVSLAFCMGSIVRFRGGWSYVGPTHTLVLPD